MFKKNLVLLSLLLFLLTIQVTIAEQEWVKVIFTTRITTVEVVDGVEVSRSSYSYIRTYWTHAENPFDLDELSEFLQVTYTHYYNTNPQTGWAEWTGTLWEHDFWDIEGNYSYRSGWYDD